MKAEMYEIECNKDDCYLRFHARATSHTQHHPGSTHLNGLSAAGLARIETARAEGYRVTVTVGGRSVGINN
jgi:hypothetical protein